jgi:hypothetical protein
MVIPPPHSLRQFLHLSQSHGRPFYLAVPFLDAKAWTLWSQPQVLVLALVRQGWLYWSAQGKQVPPQPPQPPQWPLQARLSRRPFLCRRAAGLRSSYGLCHALALRPRLSLVLRRRHPADL